MVTNPDIMDNHIDMYIYTAEAPQQDRGQPKLRMWVFLYVTWHHILIYRTSCWRYGTTDAFAYGRREPSQQCHKNATMSHATRNNHESIPAVNHRAAAVPSNLSRARKSAALRKQRKMKKRTKLTANGGVAEYRPGYKTNKQTILVRATSLLKLCIRV